jgi:ABC-type dipeptide/oligopeptide/nickel transport system permease component
VRGADYFLKRTLFAIVTVFVAITLNFIIFRATPGDAVTGLRCQFCTVEFKEQLRAELGLDQSKWEQYWIYLKSLAQGDMGRSFVTREPVVDEVLDPLLNTLPMLALGTAFAIVFGIIAGVVAAWRRGTFLDWGNLSFSLLFYSLPTQWLGLMLLLVFAGTLPAAGISDPFLEFTDPSWWETFVDRLEHMILPSATIGIVLFGEYALIVRSSLLEALSEDYVLTARAKGLRNLAIVWRHAFRASLLPVATLVALSAGYLVAGAILVEAVFSYPGIGLVTYDAVTERDYPVLQGAFLILTLSVVLANYLADLLYFKLDPRIAE